MIQGSRIAAFLISHITGTKIRVNGIFVLGGLIVTGIHLPLVWGRCAPPATRIPVMNRYLIAVMMCMAGYLDPISMYTCSGKLSKATRNSHERVSKV